MQNVCAPSQIPFFLPQSLANEGEAPQASTQKVYLPLFLFLLVPLQVRMRKQYVFGLRRSLMLFSFSSPRRVYLCTFFLPFLTHQRRLPCRWYGETIIVFEDIRIVRPYSLLDVSGSDHAAVSRVKKVVCLGVE